MGVVERRIGLLFALFLALLALAAVRAAWVGVVRSNNLQARAVTQQEVEVKVPARRGTIRDRRGVELAVSEMATTVAATPYLISDPFTVARRIAPVLGESVESVTTKLSDRDTGFVYLGRKLPADRAAKLERMEIEGLEFIPEARRTYPRDWLASQLIGTVGTDNVGLAGIEHGHEKLLHGRDGQRKLVRDALGKAISLQDVRPARSGADLTLTLDAAIQERVEGVLEGVGRQFQPRGATAMVMDPRQGEVLALANWPRVDANDVGGAPPYARQNRAIGFAYEPGSTFKAFTVAGALEDGTVTPQTSFNLPPQIQVADRTIGESHPRGYETMTTAEILAKSSNVGAIMIGRQAGARRFSEWIERFGFGKRTGVDLPGEERGLVLPLKKYSGSTMGNLPIGQGISATPMQMATAYAAIANGGILRPARVVRAVGGRPTPVPEGRRVVSGKTAASIRTMLKGVLAPGGTAPEARIPGYDLAGKTGTANKVDPTTGEYSDSRYVASFTGFAPADRPRLLVAVVVDEPKGEIYGGAVAAPAFQKIMAFALPYLRIAPR